MLKPRFHVVEPGLESRASARKRRELGERLELVPYVSHLKKRSNPFHELFFGVLQMLVILGSITVFVLAIATWLAP